MHLISFHELCMRLRVYIYFFFLPHCLAPQCHEEFLSRIKFTSFDLFREFNARTLNGIIDCSWFWNFLQSICILVNKKFLIRLDDKNISRKFVI